MTDITATTTTEISSSLAAYYHANIQEAAPGLSLSCFGMRVIRGWDLHKALTTPLTTKTEKRLYWDETQSLAATGVTYDVYRARCAYGWSYQDALLTPKTR